MNTQSKKIYSTILMLVGGLFVFIAGGIFVSQTWNLIPYAMKVACLMVMTIFLFVGSHLAEKKFALPNTAITLYYLGSCFVGLCAVSLLIGQHFSLSINLMFAQLAILFPIAFRMLCKNQAHDCIIELCLTEGIVFCILTYMNQYILSSLLISGVFAASVLTGLYAYCKKHIVNSIGTSLVLLSLTLFHLAVSIILIPVCLIFSGELFVAVIAAVLSVILTTVLYNMQKGKAFRMFQSFAFFTGCIVSVYGVFAFSLLSVDLGFIFFLALVLLLCITIVLNRPELIVIGCSYAVIGCLFTKLVEVFADDFTFYPFAFAFGLFMVIMAIKGNVLYTKKQTFCIAITFLLLDVHTYLSCIIPSYEEHHYALILFAFLSAILAFVHPKMGVWGQHLILSFSVMLTACSFAFHPMIDLFYKKDGVLLLSLEVEYACFILAMGIVLLNYLWYDKKRVMAQINFYAVTTILAVLLLNTLLSDIIGNALVLGIISVVILLIAALKNRKNYTIVSASTLTLIALYVTKSFWMSLAWWVYLFIAGVVLIVLAIRKEKNE